MTAAEVPAFVLSSLCPSVPLPSPFPLILPLRSPRALRLNYAWTSRRSMRRFTGSIARPSFDPEALDGRASRFGVSRMKGRAARAGWLTSARNPSRPIRPRASEARLGGILLFRHRFRCAPAPPFFSRRCRREKLAGEQGFEPRQSGPEPLVLPLHHSPARLKCHYYTQASPAFKSESQAFGFRVLHARSGA